MEHCLLLPHDHRIRHFGNSSVPLEEQIPRTDPIMKSWKSRKSCIYGSLSTFRRWQIAVQQSFSTMYANLHDFIAILKNSYPELVQTPSNYINMWHLKFIGSLTAIVWWRLLRVQFGKRATFSSMILIKVETPGISKGDI